MHIRPRRAVLAGSGALAAAAALKPAGAATPGAAAPLALLDTYVAGAAYQPGAAEAARQLRTGDPLALRRCPDHGYDPRTIEVHSAGGALLGHVPRIDNQAVARLMDAGVPTSAVVTAVRADAPRPQIRLAFSNRRA